MPVEGGSEKRTPFSSYVPLFTRGMTHSEGDVTVRPVSRATAEK